MREQFILLVILGAFCTLQGCCSPKYRDAVYTVHAQAEVAEMRCEMKTGQERADCFETHAKINVDQLECLARLLDSDTCEKD